MPVIECPTCAMKLEVDDDAPGRQVECGGCGQVFTPESKKKRSKYRKDDDEDDEDEDDDRRRRKRRSKYRKDDEDDEEDDDRPNGPPPRPGSPGTGIASLVLGILALLTVFFCPPISIVLLLVSVVLGIVSLWTPGRGFGIAGLILSAMSVLAMVGVFVWYLQNRQQFAPPPNNNPPGFNNPPPGRLR